MNIPLTTIEPFGVIGIPGIHSIPDKEKYAVLFAIHEYHDRINESGGEGFGKHMNETVKKIICGSVTNIAAQEGAIDPECKYVRRGFMYHVFDLSFKIPSTGETIRYGFGMLI